MLAGKKIILGITGSIAAYKAALLVRLFVKGGAEVKVVMTDAAKQFVGALTFSNLSQNPVFSGLWDGTWTEHVHLGAWADAMVIAPASANTLAKMAHGLCDNALTAVFLSAKCPILVAPAMDADMFLHPSTKRNLLQLEADGVKVMDVGSGFLASGLIGDGRMPEPEEIYAATAQLFIPQDLAGKNILISAGPTREHLDPVRFISNGSTGTMGYALARNAAARGANVTLVAGPVAQPSLSNVKIVSVISAQNMFEAITAISDQQDMIIMTAAVGDFKAAEIADKKIKKGADGMALQMVRTQDILHFLGENKPKDQILVGFALETNDEEENALGKLKRKKLNYIVLNSLRESGAGFGRNTNKVTIFAESGDRFGFEMKDKDAVAVDILNVVCKTW